MEFDGDFSAKILGKDKEFLLTKSPTILGRSDINSFFISEEIKDFLFKKFGNGNFEELKRLSLDKNKKISKTHAIITFDENKKLFEITNLSKNLIFVNKNFLSQFESVKIKNKNVLILGREMLFFIYSKEALLNYYRSRLEKFNKTKEKFSSQNGAKININYTIPVVVNVPQLQIDNKISNKKNKKRIHTNSNFKITGNMKDERLNNTVYTFENILSPNPESNFNKESDNILDDLIESSNSKIRINNKSMFQ